jgi:nucleotide-binding universal stress UspA family protein
LKILAATDFSARSQRAVRRAGLLARASDAELVLLHVVDDDQPERLVDIETREAHKYLRELIDFMAELRGSRCEPMVVAGDAFDGILRAAESYAADLVVMGAHRRQMLRDIFVGTTVERVIRTGPFPVLMVNAEVRRPYEKIAAAVELTEPSAHAIGTAKALKLTGNAALTLIHAFDPFGEGKMSLAGVGQEAIDSYVTSEQLQAGQDVVAFLEANGLARDAWSLRVRKGRAVDVISDAVEELSPDLLVMGTHGRSGLSKFFLGSVTEDVLRSAAVDILVVPPKPA